MDVIRIKVQPLSDMGRGGGGRRRRGRGGAGNAGAKDVCFHFPGDV